MNCFMSYNPNVAHEVKVTTWIKEFDGASPVYPSFPNEGDVFIVFDNDEATEPSVNKTYTSGDWADTSSGSTPTGTIYITENGEGIDVSSYATADVNVSGGSSDFTTATLVIDTAQAHSGGFYLPVIDDSDDDPMIWLVNEGYNVAEHTTPNVVLYRGACYTSIESDSNLIVTATGNVEADGEGGEWHLYITGDGTITVADGE